MVYWVYILLCGDKTYYTGVTSALEQRLSQHQSGYFPNCYTANRLPVILVYSEEFKYVWDAIAREKQIKHWSRKKKEALICGDYNLLHTLSRTAKHYDRPE